MPIATGLINSVKQPWSSYIGTKANSLLGIAKHRAEMVHVVVTCGHGYLVVFPLNLNTCAQVWSPAGCMLATYGLVTCGISWLKVHMQESFSLWLVYNLLEYEQDFMQSHREMAEVTVQAIVWINVLISWTL